MNKIDLGLPQSVVVKGAIYDTMEPRYLREELLEIDLLDGLTISVGWEPHCDPSGSFRVSLFKDYWTDWRIDYATRDIGEVVRLIQRLASATYVNWEHFVLPSLWNAHVEFSALTMSPRIDTGDARLVRIEMPNRLFIDAEWVQRLAKYVVTLHSGNALDPIYIDECEDYRDVIQCVLRFGNRVVSQSLQDLSPDSASGGTAEWNASKSGNAQYAFATR